MTEVLYNVNEHMLKICLIHSFRNQHYSKAGSKDYRNKGGIYSH